MINVTPKLVAKIFQVLFDNLKEGKTITLKQLSGECRTLSGNELSVAAVLNGFYKNDYKFVNDHNLSITKATLTELKPLDYRALTMVCYENGKTLYPIWMIAGDVNTDQDIMRTVNNQLTVLRAKYAPAPLVRALSTITASTEEPPKLAPLRSALELRTLPDADLPSQSGGSGIEPKEQLGSIGRAILAEQAAQAKPIVPRKKVEKSVPVDGPKSLGDLVRQGLANKGIVHEPDPQPNVQDSTDVLIEAAKRALAPKETPVEVTASKRELPNRSMGESEVRGYIPTEAELRRRTHISYYKAMIERMTVVLFRCALKGDTITFDDLAKDITESKPALSRVLRIIMQEREDFEDGGLIRQLLVFIDKSDQSVPYWYNKNAEKPIKYRDLVKMRTEVMCKIIGSPGLLAEATVDDIKQQQAASAITIQSMQMAVRGTLSALLHSVGAEGYELTSIMNDAFMDRHGMSEASFYLPTSRYGAIVCYMVEADLIDAKRQIKPTNEFWANNGYMQNKQAMLGGKYREYYRAFPVPHVICIQQ